MQTREFRTLASGACALAIVMLVGCATAPPPPPGDYDHIRVVHPDAGANLDGCTRLESFEITAKSTLIAPADANARPFAKARAAEHPDADTVAFVDEVVERELGVFRESTFTFFSYQCFD